MLESIRKRANDENWGRLREVVMMERPVVARLAAAASTHAPLHYSWLTSLRFLLIGETNMATPFVLVFRRWNMCRFSRGCRDHDAFSVMIFTPSYSL